MAPTAVSGKRTGAAIEARQHHSTWSHEIDLRAFCNRA
jgi:hypothetical protein